MNYIKIIEKIPYYFCFLPLFFIGVIGVLIGGAIIYGIIDYHVIDDAKYYGLTMANTGIIVIYVVTKLIKEYQKPSE